MQVFNPLNQASDPWLIMTHWIGGKRTTGNLGNHYVWWGKSWLSCFMWFPVKIFPQITTTKPWCDRCGCHGCHGGGWPGDGCHATGGPHVQTAQPAKLGRKKANDGPIWDISDISYHEMSWILVMNFGIKMDKVAGTRMNYLYAWVIYSYMTLYVLLLWALAGCIFVW